MKKITMLIVLAFTGCATVAPISYQEHCALKGLKLAGVSESNGTSSASAYNYQTGQSATAYGNSYAENIGCLAPSSPQDKCEIKNHQQTAIPKADYNDGIKGKRILNGFAYVLWVVPGVVLKLVYDDQHDKAVAKSREIASQLPECQAEPVAKR